MQTGEGGVEFGQRWGRHNSTASAETTTVFARYVNELKPVSLPLVKSPEPAAEDTISEQAGYDALAPGAFETAMSTWAPLLTEPQRDMTPPDFAAMLEGVEAAPAV